MIRLLYTKYLSGEPIKVYPDRIIGINKSGLPITMKSFNDLIISGNPHSIRFILTLLSISRVIPGWKDPDLRTIENPSTANPAIIKIIADFSSIFIDQAKLSRVPEWRLRFTTDKVNFSLKAGPNGRASLFAMYDLHILPPIIQKLIEDMGGSVVMNYYRNFLSKSRVIKAWNLIANNSLLKLSWEKFDKKTNSMKTINNPIKSLDERVKVALSDDHLLEPLTRKLSIVKDPEGKSRIIAILDFWSQNILLLLHNELFGLLRTIKEDRTFTQDPIIPKPPHGHKYYSFDLSAATDRFPIEVQESLVGQLVSKDYALRWRMLLTTEDFFAPFADTFVNYRVGQPMGAYSSWAAFTLSHHMVLYYIHDQLKLDKKYYIILGDDIVIYHDDVAKEYQYIMKGLGVELSPFKSHIS